jgi:hypothetical protein
MTEVPSSRIIATMSMRSAIVFAVLYLPLLGSMALVIRMLFGPELRGALLRAVGIFAIYVVVAAVIIVASGNGMGWLVALVFAPWVGFLSLIACFWWARRRRSSVVPAPALQR